MDKETLLIDLYKQVEEWTNSEQSDAGADVALYDFFQYVTDELKSIGEEII